MKRFSIKTKLTLWYTVLVLFLVIFCLIYLFTFSNKMLRERSQGTVKRVVTRMIEDIYSINGSFDEDNIDFYEEGVYLFLYDEQGRLIAPQTTQGLKVNALLEDGIVKTTKVSKINWLIYDKNIVVGNNSIWIRGIIDISEITNIIKMMSLMAIIAVPFFLFIAVVGGYSITARGFRPIQTIINTAAAINSGKDLSLRIGVDRADSKDEVERLSNTFDRMFDRLQTSFEAEKQFTSDASHELRTPIAIIISQCEYALEKVNNIEEFKQVISIILRQTKKMSTLVSQLLMLARADNGRIQLELEEFNLSELCELVCEELEDNVIMHKLTLYQDIQPDIEIKADQTLILRMLNNLITNAIRYNKLEGAIWVRLYQKEEFLVIEVEDSGIGMKEEYLDKIWNRFYQIEQSRNTEEGGNGLGLSMVKWIVEAHNGKIMVESFFGKGSLFQVRLSKNIV